MAGSGVFPKSDGDIAFAADYNRMDIKFATATWTSTTPTSSTSYGDVTDATVTISGLDATYTYILETIADFHIDAVLGEKTIVQIVVNGTASGETESQGQTASTSRCPASLHGTQTVTGATSYTAKLQIKSGSGTSVSSNPDGLTCRITIKALKQ